MTRPASAVERGRSAQIQDICRPDQLLKTAQIWGWLAGREQG
jgi:hypothetical protein